MEYSEETLASTKSEAEEQESKIRVSEYNEVKKEAFEYDKDGRVVLKTTTTVFNSTNK